MGKQSAKKKESRLEKFLKAPLRALIKARDMYVDAMMSCAGKFGSTAPGASNRGHMYNLPKRFSSSSSMMSGDDEYIRDLIRAASTRSLKDKLELEMLRAEVMGTRAVKGDDAAVYRSQSAMAIGRIDENAPCDFGGDVEVKVDFVPRSRSHDVPRSRVRFV